MAQSGIIPGDTIGHVRMHIWLKLDIGTLCHVQPHSGLVDVMDMARRFHLRLLLFIPFGDGVVLIFLISVPKKAHREHLFKN